MKTAKAALRQTIVDVLARSKPDMLTPQERTHAKNKSLLRSMLEHQVSGQRMPAPPAAPGAPVPDWGAGLPPELRQQLAEAGEHMRRMVDAGIPLDAYLPELFEVVHPAVQERITEFYQHYDAPEERRMPFQPRIDRQDLLRLDGKDETASAILDAADTSVLLTGLIDRIDENAPAHERKAREERERPNSERHNLRESIENAHMAHASCAEPPAADASEAFREMAPSVRSSLVAVDAYLSEKENS